MFKKIISEVAGSIGSAVGLVAGVAVGVVTGAVTGGVAGFVAGDAAGRALIEKLSPGDELEVVAVSRGKVGVEKIDKRAEFLKQAEQFRFALPKDYKFDRDEANER